ncbi:hypothetical protein N8T08_009449 [Aspergillus melleus]|uniref:Uncharacterized protein n=1 Tax=Aspergillus melleus TaxID=138277 RepID=A0ACC3BDS1_9EURO|nr:hypothetical protein N8T08_009449 [Aspergillus melleus]
MTTTTASTLTYATTMWICTPYAAVLKAKRTEGPLRQLNGQVRNSIPTTETNRSRSGNQKDPSSRPRSDDAAPSIIQQATPTPEAPGMQGSSASGREPSGAPIVLSFPGRLVGSRGPPLHLQSTKAQQTS